MIEKPQAAQAGEQENLIEQIIAQGLEKLNSPAQATATAEAPPETEPGQADVAEAEPPASKKNRRSAVYLYLLILFGAAFLMLLLAYFIQQRNSANDTSDLITPSREQLLAQIAALEQEKDALNVDLSIMQRRYAAQEQATTDILNLLLEEKQSELYGWGFIWTLEQYYQMRDYETCAKLLLLRAMSENPYPIPDAALWRYDEIVPAVINAGILKEDYYYHPEEYSELLEGDIAFDFDFNY